MIEFTDVAVGLSILFKGTSSERLKRKAIYSQVWELS